MYYINLLVNIISVDYLKLMTYPAQSYAHPRPGSTHRAPVSFESQKTAATDNSTYVLYIKCRVYRKQKLFRGKIVYKYNTRIIVTQHYNIYNNIHPLWDYCTKSRLVSILQQTVDCGTYLYCCNIISYAICIISKLKNIIM